MKELYDELTFDCRPHKIFNLDWSSYYSQEFAQAFLPNIEPIRSEDFTIYDGCRLFNKVSEIDSLIFDLWPEGQLLNIVIYTFTEDASVFDNRSKLTLNNEDIVLFVSMSKSNELRSEIKLGYNFSRFIQKNTEYSIYNDNNQRTILNKTFSIDFFNSIIKRKISHNFLLKLIFDLSELNLRDIQNIALFTNLRSEDATLAVKRRKKKIINEDGGHIINLDGEVIWRSQDNPDNGYTWMYHGPLTKIPEDWKFEDMIRELNLELITKGINSEKEGEGNRVITQFVGKSISYSEFIDQQAKLVGINATIRMYPAGTGANAYVTKQFGRTEKTSPLMNSPIRPWDRAIAQEWENSVGMGSVLATDEKEGLKMVWNSGLDGKMGVASIYDIRSILVHEHQHFSTQKRLLKIWEGNLKKYAEINGLEIENPEDIKDFLRQNIENSEGRQRIKNLEIYTELRRVWNFEIDNKLFVPQARFSDSFLEAEGFIAQIKHESFPFVSKQLLLADAILVLYAPGKDDFPEIYNYMIKQSEAYPTGDEYGSFMYNRSRTKILDRKRVFFDHDSYIAYKEYINDLFKPYSDYLNELRKNLKK